MRWTVKDYCVAIAVLLDVILAAAVLGLGLHIWDKKGDPKVMAAEEVKNPETVAKEIHVSEPAARGIVREIERSGGMPPQISYYVSSPSVEKGSEKVANQIKANSPDAPKGVLEKSDRTIITPNTDKQKVDVYKISLRKAHKLKAGMTYLDNHAYFSTGYQAGRFEGLIYIDSLGKPKGGSLLYTIKEW